MTEQERAELARATTADYLDLHGVKPVLYTVNELLSDTSPAASLVALALYVGGILGAMDVSRGTAHTDDWVERVAAMMKASRADSAAFSAIKSQEEREALVTLMDMKGDGTKH